MTTEQKAALYGQMLNEHTKIQNEISNLKSEVGGDLKPEERQRIKVLEQRQVKYDIDKKEGRVFKTEIASMPLKLTYSHKNKISENETEYYCEVIFYGDEFLGVFVIDKRGYLTDVDFPSVVSEVDEDVRLQDVLKDMGREYYFEFEHWLDSEVIPVLMD